MHARTHTRKHAHTRELATQCGRHAQAMASAKMAQPIGVDAAFVGLPNVRRWFDAMQVRSVRSATCSTHAAHPGADVGGADPSVRCGSC